MCIYKRKSLPLISKNFWNGVFQFKSEIQNCSSGKETQCRKSGAETKDKWTNLDLGLEFIRLGCINLDGFKQFLIILWLIISIKFYRSSDMEYYYTIPTLLLHLNLRQKVLPQSPLFLSFYFDSHFVKFLTSYLLDNRPCIA